MVFSTASALVVKTGSVNKQSEPCMKLPVKIIIMRQNHNCHDHHHPNHHHHGHDESECLKRLSDSGGGWIMEIRVPGVPRGPRLGYKALHLHYKVHEIQLN